MKLLSGITVVVLLLTDVASAAEALPIPAPSLKVGDTWVVQVTTQKGVSGFSRARFENRVERLDSDSMVVTAKTEGAPTEPVRHVIGLDWSLRLNIDGEEKTTAQPLSFPLVVGKSWSSDWTDSRHQGVQVSARFHRTYKVVGWEDVTVPAGTFHALKIESRGVADADTIVPAVAQSAAVATPGSGSTVSSVQKGGQRAVHVTTFSIIYYAPEVKHIVKGIDEQYNTSEVMTQRMTEELVSFAPAAQG